MTREADARSARTTAPSSQFASAPAPVDDGGARGLEGRTLPSVRLLASTGGTVDLATAAARLVLYIYPHATGTPDAPAPGWAAIPGAIGCTAESCAFRDQAAAFAGLGATVMGLSAQTTREQRRFAARKDITFPLLADPDRALAATLALPTFSASGLTLYRRITLVAEDGRIVKVFYPVFPPDLHPAEVLTWLRSYVDPSSHEGARPRPDRSP